MCGPTRIPRSRSRLLLTSDSFHCTDEKGEKGPLPPSKLSTLLTVALFAFGLVISEQINRYFITAYGTDVHPVLENERSRHIIARHIGVDAFSCLVVAYLGLKNRHILSECMTLKRDTEDSHRRIYTYQPAGHQVLLCFFAYQVKNMYDTIVWEDGALFIAHHIFAGVTAWLGMYPGVAGMYGLFFMGISEFSTCILCLLANFDPDFGVKGLEEAFPLTRIILAALFVISFITVRIVVWPLLTYHFLGDCRFVLKRNGERETAAVKTALRIMMTSSVGLTFLQFVWLGEIFVTAKEEISNML